MYIKKETLAIFVGMFALQIIFHFEDLTEDIGHSVFAITVGLMIIRTLIYGTIITFLYKLGWIVSKRIKERKGPTE